MDSSILATANSPMVEICFWLLADYSMAPFLVQQIGLNALLSLGLLAGDARLQALLSLLGLSLQAGLRIIDGLLQGLDLTVKSELDTEANAKAAKDGITNGLCRCFDEHTLTETQKTR